MWTFAAYYSRSGKALWTPHFRESCAHLFSWLTATFTGNRC
jgi:hypothetical protein